MMNKTETDKLVSEAFGATPTAMTTPIRETVEYLSGQGLLGKSAVKVNRSEIKRGDWIAFFLGDEPDEFYRAAHDGDTNLNPTGDGTEFFRLDRSVFGKSKPELKVEDIEPGARFRASLCGGEMAGFVRGKGTDVFELGKQHGNVRWTAINSDFKDIEILD